MDEQAPEAVSAASEIATTVSMAEFLESVPPNQEVSIGDLVKSAFLGSKWQEAVHTPEIQLHCPNDSCNGLRFFRCATPPIGLGKDDKSKNCYLAYRCSNCQKTLRWYSILALKNADTEAGRCYKYGERPAFGPPTPDGLIKLVGPDRDLFLKGRRCENQGLGIGAFVYYRRVVENQKNRIISEIVKVAKRLQIGTDAISELENAIAEPQFSKAMQSIRQGIPQTLFINGNNPLLFLHSALSEGLHDRDDQECLEIASSVRVILAELSERLAQALKDEAELNHAVSKLIAIKNRRK